MMDVFEQFGENLIMDEIGAVLMLQSNYIKDSSNSNLNNPDFPDSLNEFYKQVDAIKIMWQISDREKGNELKNGLQKDPWLKEHLLNNGEDLEILDEYLSGLINIQKLEDMLNPEFCKEQGYYSTIEHLIDGQNPDDYLPFDIHWTMTACLKRENGKILDNIWVVDMQGENMFDMDVTIEKYLELCYKAKGFYYWQLIYYTRNRDFGFGEDTLRESMKRFLPMLFPQVELDLSEFGIEG